MKANIDRTSLVIAGNWNLAIVNRPSWVARVGLGIDANVQFQVRVNAPLGVGNFPMYEFVGIKFTAGFEALFFLNPGDPQSCEIALRASKNILLALAHTPVSGFGLNFGYDVAEVTPDFQQRFHSASDVLELITGTPDVVSKTWINVVQTPNYLLSITCVLEWTTGRLDLNFHHNVSVASQAAELLGREGLYAETEAIAAKIASQLAAQELSTE